MGKQIQIMADSNDIYEIVYWLKQRFPDICLFDSRLNPIEIDEIKHNELFDAYIAMDEASITGLPNDYITKRTYYDFKYIEVHGGCYRKVKDGIPGRIMVSANGRIYLPTSGYVDGNWYYADDKLIRIYESAVRYIRKHCYSKFKHERNGWICYVMASARSILQREIDDRRISYRKNRQLAYLLDYYDEIVQNNK